MTAKSASMFGKEVQARGNRVDTEGQDPPKVHVCVYTIDLKGESFRLRGKPRPAEPAGAPEMAETGG